MKQNRKQQILAYLKNSIAEGNKSPTLKEIAKALQVKYLSQVSVCLKALQKSEDILITKLNHWTIEYSILEEGNYVADVVMKNGIARSVTSNTNLTINFVHKDKFDTEGGKLRYELKTEREKK